MPGKRLSNIFTLTAKPKDGKDGTDGKDAVYATITMNVGVVPCNSYGYTTSEQTVDAYVAIEKGGAAQDITGIVCKVYDNYLLGSAYAASGSPTAVTNFKAETRPTTGYVKIYVKSGTSMVSPVPIVITVTAAIDGESVSRKVTLTLEGRQPGPQGEDGEDGDDGDDAVSYGLIASPTVAEFHSNGNGAPYTPGSIDVTVVYTTTEGHAAPVSHAFADQGQIIINGVTHYIVWRKYNANGSIVPTFDGQQLLGWDRTYANPSSSGASNDMGDGLTRLDGGIRVAFTCTHKALEFAIANKYASQITSEADIIARVTVPIRRMSDGNTGPAGATGGMYMPVGKYDPNRRYTRTALMTPVIFFDDGTWNAVLRVRGHYYYLDADTCIGIEPSDVSGNPWKIANDFALVIAMGLFADFGSIASGILSGNCFFSKNGRIGNTEYNAVAGSIEGPLWKDLPAYMLFGGDPAAVAMDLTNQYRGTGTSYAPLHDAVSLTKGSMMVLKLEVTAASANPQVAAFSIGDDSPLEMEYSTSEADATWNSGTALPLVAGASYFIRVTAPSDNGFLLKVRASSGTGMMVYNLTRLLFKPNWWVDLLTGKMSGARGNFVVGADGGVTMQNAVIRGSLLYRRVKVCDITTNTGNSISIECFEAEIGGLLYDTVLIYGTYNQNKSVTLLLPPASTCVGATMEIRNVTSDWGNSQQKPTTLSIAVMSDIDAGPAAVTYSGEEYCTNRFVTPFALGGQFGAFEQLSVPASAGKRRLTLVATVCPRWGSAQTTDTYVWLLLEAE